MTGRSLVVVVGLLLFPPAVSARERTADEFADYVARRMVDVKAEKVAEFVAAVDSDDNGTISEAEFAARVDVFQQVFKSVPVKAAKSGHALPDNWGTDFSKAREESVKTGKPVLAMFSASWCGPCRAMIANVYPTDEAKKALQEFIPVYIDSEKHRDLAAKNKIQAFPTFICFDTAGESVDEHVGGGDVKKFAEMLTTFKAAAKKAAQADAASARDAAK